jgi:copper chaperone NosL
MRISGPGAVVLAVGMLLVPLAGCESADGPVEPAWGRQPCAHCGMIVGESRTAAELVSADGARLYFDDIGCMIAWERDALAAPRHAWVHDAEGPSWIDAEKAVYARGQHTPMDFGYVAHARGPGGLTFDEMRAGVLGRLAETGGDHVRP